MENEPDGQQEQQKKDCPIITAILGPIRATCKRFSTQNKPDEKTTDPNYQIAKWTKVVGSWTRGLVLIGAATAAVLIFQYRESKRADDSARLRDRAYIILEDPSIVPYPFPPKAPVLWGINPVIVNAGNTPARQVKIRFDCPTPLQSAPDRDPWRLAKWVTARASTELGPKLPPNLLGCNIPIDQVNEASQSKRDIFFVLEVTYLDGLDLKTVRRTEESRLVHIDPYGGVSLAYVDPHNCSDDDCPD